MTNENEKLRDDLRAWMNSPAAGLSKYSADPVVQRRVGGILAHCGAKISSQPQPKRIADPKLTGRPTKP